MGRCPHCMFLRKPPAFFEPQFPKLSQEPCGVISEVYFILKRFLFCAESGIVKYKSTRCHSALNLCLTSLGSPKRDDGKATSPKGELLKPLTLKEKSSSLKISQASPRAERFGRTVSETRVYQTVFDLAF